MRRTLSVCIVLAALLLMAFQCIWVVFGSPAATMSLISLQRARSERIAKDVLILAYRSPLSERIEAISELQDTLPLWEKTEYGLHYGDRSLGLPHHPPTGVQAQMLLVQADYVPMDVAATKILAHPTAFDPVQVQIILAHEHNYAVTLNGVSVLWQLYLDTSYVTLFWIEMGLGLVQLTCMIIYHLLGKRSHENTY